MDTSEVRKPFINKERQPKAFSYMRTLDTWFEVRSKNNTKISDTIYHWQNTITKCVLGKWDFKISKTTVITFVISDSKLPFFDQSQKDDKLSVNTGD